MVSMSSSEVRCMLRPTILRTDEYRQVVVKDRLDLRRYYDLEIDKATPTYLIGSVGDTR